VKVFGSGVLIAAQPVGTYRDEGDMRDGKLNGQGVATDPDQSSLPHYYDHNYD
jgi:hypothetical protein